MGRVSVRCPRRQFLDPTPGGRVTPHSPEASLSGAARLESVPTATSEMQDLFARTDWSATPLGPVESWPANLRSIVDICMSSRFPMLVCWGTDLVMVYNDGYREILGSSKHPAALGRPVRQVWPEIWDVIGPMFDGVLSGGPA